MRDWPFFGSSSPPPPAVRCRRITSGGQCVDVAAFWYSPSGVNIPICDACIADILIIVARAGARVSISPISTNSQKE